MKKLIAFIVTLIFMSGCSSTESNESISIPVDVNMNRNIDLSKYNDSILKLKSDEKNSFIGNIKHVSFVEEGIIVDASKGLYRVDENTGDIIVEYSAKGRASDEYTSIWSHWVNGDTVYIYDMNGNKIISLDIDGRYINSVNVSSKAASSPFQSIIPFGQGYIGKRVFDGLGEAIELVLYDSNYDFIKSIGDFKIKSGIKLHEQFYSYDNSILYNRYFENIIYEIDDEIVANKYIIDFGKNAIPNIESFADEYDIMDFLNRKKGNNYAALISNICETDNYLTFNFLTNGNKCVAIYDKHNLTTKTFSFTMPDMNVINTYCNNDNMYIFIDGEDKQYLCLLQIKDLYINAPLMI